MICDIYIRTSTQEQHPEKQEKECLDFLKARGYELGQIHLERLSGYKQIIRPEYDKVKERARQGKIQAVIVWALDRWVRNRDTLLEDVTVLRNYGCKIHSVREYWLEAINIEGGLGKTIQDFLLGLIGSIAELESQRKSERVKMAFRNHKGKKWGRKPIHTNKINIVLRLRNDGKTIREISKETKLGIGTISNICSKKQGGKLSIRNPPYTEVL